MGQHCRHLHLASGNDIASQVCNVCYYAALKMEGKKIAKPLAGTDCWVAAV